MKTIVSVILLLLCGVAHAQQHEQCGTDALHKSNIATNTGYARRTGEFNGNNILQRRLHNPDAIFRIPVVVHVMHKGEPIGTDTNLNNETVKNAIKNVNERFRKVAGSVGDGNGVDTMIEFALVVRAPDGKCTDGINRIDMSAYQNYMDNGVYYNSVGMPPLTMKDLSIWSQEAYYNIWVVSEFDGGTTSLTGYAGYPGMANYDGAVILASEFTDPESKTLTHQLAHSLALYHTFEGDAQGDACPGANGCGEGLGDCCNDTPPHKRSIADCFSVAGPNPCNNNSTDDSFTRNYMGYNNTSCANMFTEDQKGRMRTAFTYYRANYLPENGNLSLVPPTEPIVDFIIVSGPLACAAGEEIKLVDKTTCVPNTFLQDSNWQDISFEWLVTNDTTTYTFTTQNPVFTIDTPGIYTVKLSITTTFGTSSITKNNIIIVTGGAITACIPTSNYIIYGMIENVSFNTINKSTTQTGPYFNFTCTDNTLLHAGSSYDLSIIMNANHGNFNGSYEAFIDYNNNGVFESNELVMEGTSLHHEAVLHTQAVIIPENAVQDTMLTMRVVGAINGITNEQRNCTAAYNFGDIEDYGIYITSPLGTKNPSAIQNITLYPNPAGNVVTLTSAINVDSISLCNMLGQVVLYKEPHATQSTVDVSGLSAGAYIVQATAGGKTSSLKLIKN